MTDNLRLIERAFPLKQTSLDSVREKYGPKGHISGFHLWPARRPLAACRAALLATLLPDPDTTEDRRNLCERIGGGVFEKIERKKMPNGRVVERIKEDTHGGVLRWIGAEPKSGGRKKIEKYRSNAEFRENELAWFREQIKKAYGGRTPRLLDPFAGGGAIPFEAMRLGCEATAVDINPVAWFILKCTLEYPQQLAGKTYPLPDFIVNDEVFMEAFYKAHPHLVGRTKQTKRQKAKPQRGLWDKEDSGRIPKADLAWHVRAWGRWVLEQAQKELAPYYPTYADFEPLNLRNPKPYEKQPMRLIPLNDDGEPHIDALNTDFSKEYLADKRNPRWVEKSTVAYLWARTVTCKNCRAIVPLLKTRWLCKKDKKRVLFSMIPKADKSGVEFDIVNDVPVPKGNPAQKREHDKRIGAGTMSRSGATCPCCNTIMTMVDIKVDAKRGLLNTIPTVVVVSGQKGKQYRLPSELELESAKIKANNLDAIFEHIPHGILNEATPAGGGKGASRAFSVQNYGQMQWKQLFSKRQLLALGILLSKIRHAHQSVLIEDSQFAEAIHVYMATALDRLVDQLTTIATWYLPGENVKHTFVRYALPVMWDYAEANPLFIGGGSWTSAVNLVGAALDNALSTAKQNPSPNVIQGSAISIDFSEKFDLIVTDPPYYDAIPYSDLMDLFYIWLRRSLHGLSPQFNSVMDSPSTPKWDEELSDGELIDDETRHHGDPERSRLSYEDGMYRAFAKSYTLLSENGRLVVVFAHKHPNAWETLVAAMIRAGFIVTASWPIQTENVTRSRARSSAALSSSVWLVCKKRPIATRPGWDNKVLEEMRAKITDRLRDYWDAGIRGPDFVWAATGPALEAYSKHPIVKKANTPGEVMSVGEFLSHVRRMVVDFVVGQVLSGEKGGADMAAADRMDAPTAYYLLHRHDFGLEEAPAGACILYATACGLSDRDLESAWDLVSHKGTTSQRQDEDDEPDPDDESELEENGDSGSKIKLKTWVQRKRSTMGFEAPSGRPIPLIDRIHRLMHLWRAGDVHKVDEYLDDNGLRRQELFKRLVQSLIELSNGGSDERSILESLSNHVHAKGATVSDAQKELNFGDSDIAE